MIIFTFLAGSNDSDNSDNDENINKIREQAELDKGMKNEVHPLITDLDYRNSKEKRTHKAELFFERDVFKNLINENDEDADLDKMVEDYKKKGAAIAEKATKNGNLKEESSDSDYSSESEESDYDVEKSVAVPANNPKKDGFEIVKNNGLYLYSFIVLI